MEEIKNIQDAKNVLDHLDEKAKAILDSTK